MSYSSCTFTIRFDKIKQRTIRVTKVTIYVLRLGVKTLKMSICDDDYCRCILSSNNLQKEVIPLPSLPLILQYYITHDGGE